MARRAKENLSGGSLRYLLVYFKTRIFKCSYRIYIYIHNDTELELAVFVLVDLVGIIGDNYQKVSGDG
jgi:hypothetical protein